MINKIILFISLFAFSALSNAQGNNKTRPSLSTMQLKMIQEAAQPKPKKNYKLTTGKNKKSKKLISKL
jgi:hypothetical protein